MFLRFGTLYHKFYLELKSWWSWVNPWLPGDPSFSKARRTGRHIICDSMIIKSQNTKCCSHLQKLFSAIFLISIHHRKGWPFRVLHEMQTPTHKIVHGLHNKTFYCWNEEWKGVFYCHCWMACVNFVQNTNFAHISLYRLGSFTSRGRGRYIRLLQILCIYVAHINISYILQFNENCQKIDVKNNWTTCIGWVHASVVTSVTRITLVFTSILNE